jgi:TonB-dependent starch-binding outer membrane protein SusC
MKKYLDYYGFMLPYCNCNKLLLTMKITCLLLFCSIVNLVASPSYSQNTRISLSLKNATIEQVLNKIEDESEFYFFFNQKLIDVSKNVNIEVDHKPIKDVLEAIFDHNVDWTVRDRQIILTPSGSSNFPEFQQQQQITGIVSDENGGALPGVNIRIEGTTIGTISDINGKFSISLPDRNAVLEFSFIGYESKKVSTEGKSVINVSLVRSLASLDEVVVIGYGMAKKSDLTGSITSLKNDEYRDQPVTRVDQILQGRTSGVNVTNSSGAPGGTSSIRIRGSNSITGNNDPLYVIDGFVGGNFQNVNPTDIETIQILKDASSTAVYGSRGANGVVLITTKSGVSGKPKLSFTSRFMTSKVAKTWDLMDAGDFAQTVNERADALGS